MTARVDPATIAAIESEALCLGTERDTARESIRIFAVLGAWGHAYKYAHLPGMDAPQAPPICEWSIVRLPMTRGFQLVEADEPRAVPAMVCLVTGDDAETPIGLCAWCLDQPEDIYNIAIPSICRALASTSSATQRTTLPATPFRCTGLCQHGCGPGAAAW
jgi:hypothetical protein